MYMYIVRVHVHICDIHVYTCSVVDKVNLQVYCNLNDSHYF